MIKTETGIVSSEVESAFVGNPIRRLCERPATLRLITSDMEDYEKIKLVFMGAASARNHSGLTYSISNGLMWDHVIPDKFVLYSQGAIDAKSIMDDQKKMIGDLLIFLSEFGVITNKLARDKGNSQIVNNRNFIEMLKSDGREVTRSEHPLNGKDIVEFRKETNVKGGAFLEVGIKKDQLKSPEFNPVYVRVSLGSRAYDENFF